MIRSRFDDFGKFRTTCEGPNCTARLKHPKRGRPKKYCCHFCANAARHADDLEKRKEDALLRAAGRIALGVADVAASAQSVERAFAREGS